MCCDRRGSQQSISDADENLDFGVAIVFDFVLNSIDSSMKQESGHGLFDVIQIPSRFVRLMSVHRHHLEAFFVNW